MKTKFNGELVELWENFFKMSLVTLKRIIGKCEIRKTERSITQTVIAYEWPDLMIKTGLFSEFLVVMDASNNPPSLIEEGSHGIGLAFKLKDEVELHTVSFTAKMNLDKGMFEVNRIG